MIKCSSHIRGPVVEAKSAVSWEASEASISGVPVVYIEMMKPASVVVMDEFSRLMIVSIPLFICFNFQLMTQTVTSEVGFRLQFPSHGEGLTFC